MDDLSGEKDLENIKLYYENQLLRNLLMEQQNEVKRKEEQIDRLQDKISVLLNAFMTAREQKLQRTCSERCKEERKYLERDITVKKNAYLEVETKFMDMNRYLQEVEEQNKRLLNEISILTEKETIRQLTASQENLTAIGSNASTPSSQQEPFPRIRMYNEKEDTKLNSSNSHKSSPQDKPRSRKIRIPIRKGKSFNFEKAAKANAKC